jgi:benzoate/toluate 1,2-dioxygenase alpha subunit
MSVDQRELKNGLRLGERRDLGELVDDSNSEFRIRTEIYNDPAVFKAEMQNVFRRTWVYLGHESEVPYPGDYKTTTIGTQPVVISRHEDGEVYVLFNRCRHRGAVVCRDEKGHSNYFRCPYHNWVYENDGKCIGMAMSSGYPEDLDKSSFSLQRVARVGTYRGLIFANLSEEGPSLEEHLAPVRKYIDWWFGRSPEGEVEVIPVGHKYPYPGNWKWQAENGHDGYHGNYVHISWQKVLQRAGESQLGKTREVREQGCTRGFSHGHGILERPGGLSPVSSWTGRMMERYPEYKEALYSQYSEEEIKEISARRNIFIFPNMYLFDTHIRVITPVTVDRTEVSLDVYALKGVPESLNEGRYRAHERFYGPSGFGAPDDLEIFTCNETGMKATEVEWLFFNRGQYREAMNNGERVGHSTDETPHRSIYREWKRLMSGVEVLG